MKEYTEQNMSARVYYLIAACEKGCEAGCCGRNAFDIHPIHLASYLMTYSGMITDEEIEEICGDIDQLLDEAITLEPDYKGYICSIKCMCDSFTLDDLEKLYSTLKKNVRLTRPVFDYSATL